jgi:hypothetical protein
MIAYNPKHGHLINEHGQMAAVRMFRDKPHTRTKDQHLLTVWCNCGDYFGWDYMVFFRRMQVNEQQQDGTR